MLRVFLALMLLSPGLALSEAEVVETPYEPQKVVFDFFLDDPNKINPALFWIRSLVNPLMASPYDYAIDDLNIIVVIHGTEIVTMVEHNYAKYKEAVERMRYYSDLGVQFKVCGLAASDYSYTDKDFYDFVQLVPSAITELTHWQSKGYSLLTPNVMEKKFTIEEIR